jgi:hypothetical protein
MRLRIGLLERLRLLQMLNQDIPFWLKERDIHLRVLGEHLFRPVERVPVVRLVAMPQVFLPQAGPPPRSSPKEGVP